MLNVKTPNKKRKSLGNAAGESPQAPKAGKLDTNVKTPGKSKNNATPGKPNKTPKGNVQQNNTNTPKQTPAKNQQQTPAKTQEQRSNSLKKSNKKNKRSSESENETSPLKKLKMFGGTSEVEESQQSRKQGDKPQGKQVKQNPQKKEGGGEGKKKKGQFFNIRQKLNSGKKEEALEELEKKIKTIQERKELTKTAKRKLSLLHKLRKIATGDVAENKPPSDSKKRRERKKQAKARHAEGNEDQQSQVQKQTKQKPNQQKVTTKVGASQVEDDEEDDSSESDYEVDAEIKPDKIIKTSVNVEEEEEDEDDDEGDDDDDDEGEQEESGEENEDDGDDSDSDESEEEEEEEEEDVAPPKVQKGKKVESQKGKFVDLNDLKENEIISKKQSRYIVFVGNLPYDATKQEISEHFKKAGEVRHIRIPLDKQTNKPRGFAYVELHDEISYQKALSLHHTFIKGRRINVLYTQGGKKKGEEKKNEVKVKNLKLQAMRKQGQLAGSVKESQKRAARRGKKGQVNGA